MVFEFIPGYDGAVPNSISTLAQYMAKSPLAREPGASLDISRYSLLMPAQHSMRIYGFISHAPRTRDIAARSADMALELSQVRPWLYSRVFREGMPHVNGMMRHPS